MKDIAQPEIYPMPMFATIQVREVQKSVEWYKRALSFTIIYEMPGPDGRLYLAHMRRQKYQDLLLAAAKSSSPIGEVAGARSETSGATYVLMIRVFRDRTASAPSSSLIFR